MKERIVREVGYGLSLEGASAADLVKSIQAMAKGLMSNSLSNKTALTGGSRGP